MVSANPTENLVPVTKEAIEAILTSNVSESIGAILISFNENKIILGAMNPLFSEVKNIKEKLSTKFNVIVELQTISSEEFEKWFDQSDKIKDLKLTDDFSNDEFASVTETTVNEETSNKSLLDTESQEIEEL